LIFLDYHSKKNPTTYRPDFSDILSDHEVQGLMAYIDFMGKQ